MDVALESGQMKPIYGVSVIGNGIWLEILFVWGASIPIWARSYAAYKFRRCRGRFWFFIAQGFALLTLFALLGAALLFPSVFSSDAMDWVINSVALAVPVTSIVGIGLLRKFEVKHPEEAERSCRTEEELFR